MPFPATLGLYTASRRDVVAAQRNASCLNREAPANNASFPLYVLRTAAAAITLDGGPVSTTIHLKPHLFAHCGTFYEGETGCARSQRA